MKNQTFRETIENLWNNEEKLVVVNQQFSNEIFMDENRLLQCSILADLFF